MNEEIEVDLVAYQLKELLLLDVKDSIDRIRVYYILEFLIDKLPTEDIANLFDIYHSEKRSRNSETTFYHFVAGIINNREHALSQLGSQTHDD